MNARDDGADWRARALLIADKTTAPADEAIAACDARLLGTVGWQAASDRLDRQGMVDVILAEAGGVAAEMLDRVLPRLETLAREGDTRVVVTLEPEQIDAIAAQLSAPGIELLCLPTSGERIAAMMLASAATPDARLHDVAREGESVWLRRLNAEVARIAETLARLTQGDAAEARADAVAERTLRYDSGPRPDALEIAPREIRDAIRARRMRDQMFGGGLFEDPAWDMLLDLFAAEIERAQVSVSSLCIAAAVAPTTALRWIARMTEAGLFERRPDPFDRRRAFMALSERASAGMRDYVGALRRAGLRLG